MRQALFFGWVCFFLVSRSSRWIQNGSAVTGDPFCGSCGLLGPTFRIIWVVQYFMATKTQIQIKSQVLLSSEFVCMLCFLRLVGLGNVRVGVRPGSEFLYSVAEIWCDGYCQYILLAILR